MLYYGRTFMCQQLNEMIKDKLFPIPLIKKKKKYKKEKKRRKKNIIRQRTTSKSLFLFPRSIDTMGFPKPTTSPINLLKQLIQTSLWFQNTFGKEESLFERAPFKLCQVKTGFVTEGALSKKQLIKAQNCSGET